MAIIVNSKFTPFSFDEMLKPALMAHQMHQDLEDQYTELATKANEWENLANEQTNPEAYRRYKTYSDDLKAQADILASSGLTPTSRRALSQMKTRYNSEIEPIKKAYESLQETNNYRDKIKASNPGAIFTVPKYTSLDYFLNGNTADNSYINEKDVLNRVASKAQIEGTKMFNMLLNEGESPDVAIKKLWSYMQNPNNTIVKEELKALGIDKYNTEDQKRILNAVNTGMYNAASDIVEGEYLTRKEREALKLQKTSAERANKQYDLQIAKFNLDMAESGYKYDAKTKSYVPDESSPVWTKDPKTGKLVKAKLTSSPKTKETTRGPMLSTAVVVNTKGRSINVNTTDAPEGWDVSIDATGNMTYKDKKGQVITVSENTKKRIDNIIKNGDYNNYIIRITKNGEVVIIPNDIKIFNPSLEDYNFNNI